MTRAIERLRPHQIEDALRHRSLIYLPLGTIEWHCHHLPVGLDALTAHGLCLAAAERSGGLVWPPLFYGTGGDHGAFPWTVMMPDAGAIEALLRFTLQRLSQLGLQEVVIFSGHFAETQLEMIDRIAAEWNALAAPPQVRAMSVNRAKGIALPPDHAGQFETTLLAALHPDLIDLGRLAPDPDTGDRFDPQSPLWGIVGADPRQPVTVDPKNLVAAIVDWLAAR